jgi:hypothetical protein
MRNYLNLSLATGVDRLFDEIPRRRELLFHRERKISILGRYTDVAYVYLACRRQGELWKRSSLW